MTDSANIRSQIIDVLQLIASSAAQVEYQRRAPHIDVSTELFSQWEDWYYPDSQAFREAFTEQELSTLATFNGNFETICQRTPSILPPLVEFMKTDDWKNYQSAAAMALQDLDL